MERIRFYNTDITGGFWKEKQDMVRNSTVTAVFNRFYDTYRFEALKCDTSEGLPYKPHIYWDSDVAKWMEGVAYLISKQPDEALLKIVEDSIDLIIKNADEHGYFNSHFLVTEQDMRFKNRSWHELYCAGHLIEAAVAYKEATGRDDFLRAMCKFADYIEKVFLKEKSAAFNTPGHPELELALVKLYEATGERRYLELSKYFIDEHGKKGSDGAPYPWCQSAYNQDEMPLRDRNTIDGHSVRAFYLYSGAADIALRYNDKELADACRRVFDNAYNKRMYVTGGFGSTHIGEAFTVDYDLPSRNAYAETCAAISMVYFASRMLLLENDRKYADCIERIIYNGFLSGVSLDGKAFFYENPLEIDPDFNNVNYSTKDKQRMPITQRKEVFDCSCCPPNIVRFIPSIGDYMYTYDDNTLYVHQYMESKMSLGSMTAEQSTDYPRNGNITLKINSEGRKIALRIPAWCRSFTLNVPYVMVNGYATVEPTDESIELSLDMPVTLVRANNRVHDCAGRVAVMRGPVVYCAEGVDNGKDLKNLRISASSEFTLGDSELLLPKLHTVAYMPKATDELYSFVTADDYVELPLTLIPYYAFANRGETEMYVWLLEK